MNKVEVVTKIEEALNMLENMEIPNTYGNIQRMKIIFDALLEARKKIMDGAEKPEKPEKEGGADGEGDGVPD